MPVKTNKDSKGCYAQWGSGKKYYYPCGDEKAMNEAKQKAHIQGATVQAKTGKYEEAETFEPPQSGDAPKEVKAILDAAYSSCRLEWTKKNPEDKENMDNKQKCAQIAWGAVKNAGFSKDKDGKWTKTKTEGDKTEMVSEKSWASVNKSNLPKSAFLWIEGDGDTKDKWHLPYKDEEGNINLGALRAISAAIAGARTGKPMEVPPEVITRLNKLLKKYKIGEEGKESYSDISESINMFQNTTESNVDSENKIIRNVAVMGTPNSKNGYTYSDKAMTTLTTLTEGAPLYINHPSKSEMKERDGVRDVNHWAGVFFNARKEGSKVFADIKVREPFWRLVSDVATIKPAGFGNSINSRVKVVKDYKTGRESILDIDKLKSIDLVSQAATTTNLFESEHDLFENENDEIEAIYKDLNIKEGLIADKMKERESERKICDIQWKAQELIDEILRDKVKTSNEKKVAISDILDDLENEISKILNDDMGNMNDESDEYDSFREHKTNNKEETMDFSTITLEQIKTERPDLFDAIGSSMKTSEKIESLEVQNEDLNKELKEVKESFETIKTEAASLKEANEAMAKELDEYKLAEVKAKKEAFISSKLKEVDLPSEAISDFFRNDLMSKEEDAIEASIKDRKEAWLGSKASKVVKGAGEEFKADKNESDKNSDKNSDPVENFVKAKKGK